MTVTRRLLAAVAVGVAVVGASTGAALAQYPPTAQTGSVSSTVVIVGGQVEFAGTGFANGSKVDITVNGALFTTVTAGDGASPQALGDRLGAHYATAAFVRPRQVAPDGSASFLAKVTLQSVGTKVLVGSGVDPAGDPALVKATVTVLPAQVTTAAKASSLPFTGSSVLIPGAIVGLAMLGGGLLLLTSVRSRKVTAGS